MKRIAHVLIWILLFTSLVGTAGCISGEQVAPTPRETSPSEEPSIPEIIIENYDIGTVEVIAPDKLYVSRVDVFLQNDGSIPVSISKVVISSKEHDIEGYPFKTGTMLPRDRQKVSLMYGSLGRDLMAERVAATIKVFGTIAEESEKQILAQKDISILTPTIGVGDTMQEIKGTHELSLTLLSFQESNVAVDGPYVTGYYTFTAKPHMKFIILAYRFDNNWIREQEAPYINEGEIVTSKGYIYSSWYPVGGVHAEEYNPREATEEEIATLIGDSGGYEHLLPEQSIVGRIVFEIPKDATPIEASIRFVPSLIKLQ